MNYNFETGCSAMSWESLDKKHFWGCNFDFNHYANGTNILFVPRNYPYYLQGSSLEKNLVDKDLTKTKYAMIGMGSNIMQSTPVMYEGINENGLMGGQLYFRTYSKFLEEPIANTISIQPIYVVLHVLAQCKNVEDVEELFTKQISVLESGVFEQIPQIHWFFSNQLGNNIVIEYENSELKIYKNKMGVLTNSPDYDFHLKNLANYVNLQSQDYETVVINSCEIKNSYSGNGMVGLPGDCTSPSRFIKLALLKNNAIQGENEVDAINKMFHLLGQVSFPQGLVKTGITSDITKHDHNIVNYDYTIYTAIMCSESLKYYWTTYENPQIQMIDLNHLLTETELIEFEFKQPIEIKEYRKN